MADQVEEPLMGSNGIDDPENVHEVDLVGTVPDVHTRALLDYDAQNRGPTVFVWLLTFAAGVSGLLFGYDTGVISSTLISIGSSLSSRPLTTTDKSLITASTSLCALLISPLSGHLASTLGRKRLLLFADTLFIAGALLQALTSTVTGMIAGRSIVGLAVGAASFVTPLYIAELAPARYRGRLVTLNVLFITLGQVVAYLVGWAFAEWGGRTGWRWMVGLGAAPAAVQFLAIGVMPESPRWLIQVGRGEQARLVLGKVYGSGSGDGVDKVVAAVAKRIEIEVREEDEAKRGRMRGMASRKTKGLGLGLGDSWGELFFVPRNRRALTIACLLQGLQQLCGFNSLMYYSATLFALLHFTTPTLTSLTIACTNALFTLVSLFLIDYLGRRRILLLSIPVMAFALAVCAGVFPDVDLSSSSSSSFSTSSSPNPSSSKTPTIILLTLTLYVASYALGLGNVPWQQSELFPLSVRSLGSGLSTATNWLANFIVGVSFLPLLESWGPAWTFGSYALVCVLGWAAIWVCYPETSGLGLEDVGRLLEGGWGVGRKLGDRGRDG